jgi:hypothetical protein
MSMSRGLRATVEHPRQSSCACHKVQRSGRCLVLYLRNAGSAGSNSSRSINLSLLCWSDAGRSIAVTDPPSMESYQCLIKDHNFIIVNMSSVESQTRDGGWERTKIKWRSKRVVQVLKIHMNFVKGIYNVFVVDLWFIYFLHVPYNGALKW